MESLALPPAKRSPSARILVFLIASASLLAIARPAFAAPGDIFAFAGTGDAGGGGDGEPALAAQLSAPRDVAVGPDGSVYIADYGDHRIRKVAPNGIITTVAGTGEPGFNGDGIPATSAKLEFPAGVIVDGAGNVYLSDKQNDRIRRIDPLTGFIFTIAGNGLSGSSGDGGLAPAAHLNNPAGLAFGPDGSLFIADEGNNKIRKIDPLGVITNVAGTASPAFRGTSGPPSSRDSIIRAA
jgi:serine/threonine-protein kinase